MKEENFYKLIILSMIVFAVIFWFKENSHYNKILNNGKSTICKLTLCEQRGKSSVAFVKYYIDGKKYRTSAGGCPKGREDKVNKYFSMKYDEENPNDIIVDFSSEIKDSISIKELEEKIKFSMFN
ncbi:hypothetical protein [Flavobacterium humi]|uniref:Uncharacterized protein n=1 Tax=Flavobacterium humi TaxID=2562683 RepID=A0A4Z0LBW4_9FLAO|nr:hypothetical protein [Flavobacterium humi]TGD59379.1 hypothetical protein E4635_00120 [Flavobacterium humi]